jgi:hypothetical protein
MEGDRGGFLGLAHSWLFTTDEAANPYLLWTRSTTVSQTSVAVPSHRVEVVVSRWQS